MKSTFISYSTQNKEIADKLVEALEKKGLKCYIAPRDIRPGKIYACEIVEAIKNQDLVTVIFSKESNASRYVLCEINSAVLHNKTIIPYKIDSTEPSDSMEFYLGISHWISVDGNIEESINLLVNAIKGVSASKGGEEERETSGEILYKGPVMLDYEELQKINFDVKRIVMATIELDYLTLEDGDYVINEEIEGSVDTWIDHVRYYPDLYSLLIKDDKLIGYWQFILMNEKNYSDILDAKTMVNPSMLDFYEFGGDFYCYICIMPILREYENASIMMLLWDKLFERIEEMMGKGIVIKKIGISVYSQLLEKIVQKLGFTFVKTNDANGKIYDLDMTQLKNNTFIKSRYISLYNKLTESE